MSTSLCAYACMWCACVWCVVCVCACVCVVYACIHCQQVCIKLFSSLSVHLSQCIYVYLPVHGYPRFHPSVHPSIYLPVHLSVYLSFYFSVYLSLPCDRTLKGTSTSTTTVPPLSLPSYSSLSPYPSISPHSPLSPHTLLSLSKVYIEALRTMHLNTISALELPSSTITVIEELLNDLSKLLEGV